MEVEVCSTSQNLKRLIIDTTDEVQCFECEWKANNMKSIMNHKKQGHSKPSAMIKDICDSSIKRLSYKYNLNKHTLGHSQIDSYECDMCEYTNNCLGMDHHVMSRVQSEFPKVWRLCHRAHTVISWLGCDFPYVFWMPLLSFIIFYYKQCNNTAFVVCVNSWTFRQGAMMNFHPQMSQLFSVDLYGHSFCGFLCLQNIWSMCMACAIKFPFKDAVKSH